MVKVNWFSFEQRLRGAIIDGKINIGMRFYPIELELI